MKLSLITLLIFCLISFSSCRDDDTDSGDTQSIQQLNPFAHPDFGTPVRWNLDSALVPLKIHVSEDFLLEELSKLGVYTIEDLAKSWDQAKGGKALFQFPFATTINKDYDSLPQFYDHEIGIYKSYKWFAEVDNSALAITQFFGETRLAGTAFEYIEIDHADIIFNALEYNFTMDENDIVRYDFPSVVIHELGHLMGLGHSPENGHYNVMLPYLLSMEVRRDLSSYDQGSIRGLYENLPTASVNKMAITSGAAKSSEAPKRVRGIIEVYPHGKCRTRIFPVKREAK